ncbi:sugar MFS transporter [Rufibacter ruber]|uniref:sugar MFS transporter n=1 Tax=Rufibacter ruber TaxID=1783499 RepID=UPI0008360589|nr:sugar MFS transporter [Rufibacter ruber]
MSLVTTSPETSAPPLASQTGSARPIIIIGALFFIFGFVTWLNSVLIPYLQIACELSTFASYMVVAAFYMPYLMAMPSAWVLKTIGFKKGMSVGLIVMAVGALVFVPAAMSRTYGLFLLGLFLQGTGLALLQTAANPYITILGPRESAAKRISIMGICNKIAGICAPIALGAVALKDADALVKQLAQMDLVQKTAQLDALAQRVIVPYCLMVGVLLVLALVVYFSSLPEVDTDQEDEAVAAANSGKKSILQFPHLLLGTAAMFLYVGVEVIAGDTIISYGASQGIAFATAKFFTSFTLGAMIVGYLVGIVTIPRFISQENALKLSAVLGIVFGLGAIFTDGFVSVLCVSLMGLANALVFPAIWPLAIAGLGRFTKIGSSFLIMALAGGAVLPLLYGYLADHFDPQQAYWLVIPCYLFILYFATAGHKVKSR